MVYTLPKITSFPHPIVSNLAVRQRIAGILDELGKKFDFETEEAVCDMYATVHNTVVNIRNTPVNTAEESKYSTLLINGLEYLLADVRCRMMIRMLIQQHYVPCADLRYRKEH